MSEQTNAPSLPTRRDSAGALPTLVFAADLGGTSLRAALIDQNGKIHLRLRRHTPRTAENPNEIVDLLLTAARECEAESFRLGRRVESGCVVVPGTIDAHNQMAVDAKNIPCLDKFPLKEALEEKLAWPVSLENDANAAALGEMWQGAGRGFSTMICITLGTGIGGGIILDGKLWRGVDGSAGEIGHASVDPFGGISCKCGNQGCLEVYASATAIKRMANDIRPRYPKSELYANESLEADEIYAAGMRGDELAREVFCSVGVYLGIALANLVNLINPELIVIGGGVASGWKLFEAPMFEQLRERSFSVPASRVKVVPAACGDDAGLLGAAFLAIEV
jgi:glucokinase